ncbi:hypothetical protein QAD02_020505 [Eretmocerus hayati]|uniref:Uncharacterized protein n=1 Tax=Eretmocerus hayati TaxID=131215 RepID=A0ACC2PMU1_9HYME|nr:hypothetical protein QAD02_020505 [Eretmocerus hayati]
MPPCCVSGCDSGSFQQVRESKAANQRPKSFFRLPKDHNLAGKWKEVLTFEQDSQQRKELRVCEDHFFTEDLIISDELALKDGEIWGSGQGRRRLGENAIPISLKLTKNSSISDYDEQRFNTPDHDAVSLLFRKQWLSERNVYLILEHQFWSAEKVSTIFCQVQGLVDLESVHNNDAARRSTLHRKLGKRKIVDGSRELTHDPYVYVCVDEMDSIESSS